MNKIISMLTVVILMLTICIPPSFAAKTETVQGENNGKMMDLLANDAVWNDQTQGFKKVDGTITCWAKDNTYKTNFTNQITGSFVWGMDIKQYWGSDKLLDQNSTGVSEVDGKKSYFRLAFNYNTKEDMQSDHVMYFDFCHLDDAVVDEGNYTGYKVFLGVTNETDREAYINPQGASEDYIIIDKNTPLERVYIQYNDAEGEVVLYTGGISEKSLTQLGVYRDEKLKPIAGDERYVGMYSGYDLVTFSNMYVYYPYLGEYSDDFAEYADNAGTSVLTDWTVTGGEVEVSSERALKRIKAVNNGGKPQLLLKKVTNRNFTYSFDLKVADPENVEHKVIISHTNIGGAHYFIKISRLGIGNLGYYNGSSIQWLQTVATPEDMAIYANVYTVKVAYQDNTLNIYMTRKDTGTEYHIVKDCKVLLPPGYCGIQLCSAAAAYYHPQLTCSASSPDVGGGDDDDQDKDRRHIEAEKAGGTNWSKIVDTYASGGYIAENVKDNPVIFENVPQSNKIKVAYTAKSTAGWIELSIKKGEGWEDIGAVYYFPTGGNGRMDTGDVTTSETLDIPEGSTVKMVANTLVALDYFEFLYTEGAEPTGGRRVEAENAGGGGTKDPLWYTVDDEYASGGKIAGYTKDNALIFSNVPESNKIKAAYAATSNNYMTVYIRKDDVWEQIGTINYSTTDGNRMNKGKVAASDILYIPAGSTVKIVPPTFVSLDYIEFLAEAVYTEADVPQNTVLAKNTKLGEGATTQADIMATVGTAVKLTGSGQTISFFSPVAGNVCSLKYKAEQDAQITISINDAEKKTVALPAATGSLYGSYGIKDLEIDAGDSVCITYRGESSILLDSIAINRMFDLTPAPDITIPQEGDRAVYNLDGIWECTSTARVTSPSDAEVSQVVFDNTMPVPGLWDMASMDMGNYEAKSLWYRKIVELPSDFSRDSCRVSLDILRAFWGRSLYLNGSFVDTFQHNYVNSSMDITKYLKAGQNEIVIMLGDRKQQMEYPGLAHVTTDFECTVYEPGIYDSVHLVLSRAPKVTSIQTAAKLEDAAVQTRIKLENNSETDVTTDVEINIYECGVFENGTAKQDKSKVGTYTEKGVTVTAGGTAQVDVAEVNISGFDTEKKAWKPENPYLYEIEVKTSGDTLAKRFGMRTFTFDPATKLPMLNGKVYYLRGTNVNMNRFFTDSQRGEHPWNEEWVRALYKEYKDVNWEGFRFALGSAPSLWYELADEMGLMVIDEYAFWICEDWCDKARLMTEIHAWIDEKQTHASIINWDMQNEKKDTSLTGAVITEVLNEGYDIDTGRVWDNGWAAPPNERTTIECHPYLFSDNGFTLSKLNDLSEKSFDELRKYLNAADNNNNITNPMYINEYGWLWLSRDGDPTSLTKPWYDANMPDATREERKNFYAEALAQLTEFWRGTRGLAGIFQFTGLSYQDGHTSDVLEPDISTPKIRSEMKEMLRNSFARLGILIGNYTEQAPQGKVMEFPVKLINDYNNDITALPVTLNIYNGDGDLLNTQTKNFDVSQAGAENNADVTSQTFTYKIPETTDVKNGDVLRVTAEYTYQGETIYSQRKITVDNSIRESIARNKPCTASSQSMDPANAVDGNTDTRWASKWQDDAMGATYAWLTVDLGAVYNIDGGKIQWENAYAKEYKIQVSDDNVNFRDICTVTDGNAGVTVLDMQGTGRYVRVECLKNATAWGFSIFEFEVYGLRAPGVYYSDFSFLQNGEAIEHLQEGTVDVKISVENSAGAATDGVLLVALYDGNTVHEIQTGYFTVEGGKTEQISCEVKVPALSNGDYKVKAFLWNSLDDMTPLVPARER